MNKVKSIIRYAVLLLFLAITGCKQVGKLTDVFTKPTAREIYARNFEDNDRQFTLWSKAFEQAKKDSLLIQLPYVEVAKSFSQRNTVYSYNVNLKEGVELEISVVNNDHANQFFIDVLHIATDSNYVQMAHNKINEHNVRLSIDNTGTYKVLVQPAINAQINFELRITSAPRFRFPVVGKANDAIQSFWGAARDAGARSHQGIDIFAERGTPVVAATDGRITSTGNRGLGGKQVWLRTGMFGKSLYYAHLDSIIAKVGDRVISGDTLGLVGNTGNARTTDPHLHFGIYASGKGAIDPLPFVWKTNVPEQQNDMQVVPRIAVSAVRANLRNSPTTNSLVIGEALKNDTLHVLGRTKMWSHVLTRKGKKAFIHSSLITQP
ncbi:peptidoglycan DD-metalloendopeptidase family protein [Maribacter sp. LLG6340-A2]|uniref:peptidoglycan DD-metalloendopeptidase family protein n=1 Tax=Maribacter sp. LLG6340-A2 TaxID=3160834 RepID=UPI00386CEBF9